MDKAKLILMRNKKNRIVNGVRPNQIVEVAENNVATYKMYGFEEYNPKNAPKANVEGGNASDANKLQDGEREKMEAFLKDHGVNVAPNWKDGTVAKKATELGYGQGQDFDPTANASDGTNGTTDEEDEEDKEEE